MANRKNNNSAKKLVDNVIDSFNCGYQFTIADVISRINSKRMPTNREISILIKRNEKTIKIGEQSNHVSIFVKG